MTKLSEDELVQSLSGILLSPSSQETIEGIDEDLVKYMAGLLSEGLEDEHVTNESVQELIGPFLESVDCPDDISQQAIGVVVDLATTTTTNTTTTKASGGARRLKQGLVNMSSSLETSTAAEDDANRFLWGTDGNKVHAMTNTIVDAHQQTTSSKDRRKARQELEKARREYQAKLEREQAEESRNNTGAVAAMVLPDYTSNRGERDVQIRNVSLSLDNGKQLLDGGELRFAHQRRYGLVGKNGVGKTTLLKAIAAQQVDGIGVDILRHMRILHVRQEIQASGSANVSVLQAVLNADVERNTLLQEEQELLARLEQDENKDDDGGGTGDTVQQRRAKLQSKKGEASGAGADGRFQEDLKKLDLVYARLQLLASDSAEARASMILAGLQFTTDMQRGPTSALSGGWRMRVALAAALFIEPDLLMLDEPTNHLDLEAVLWLEHYLLEYKHTLIVVSHDRGFLNEVCTDVIEFKNQKLTCELLREKEREMLCFFLCSPLTTLFRSFCVYRLQRQLRHVRQDIAGTNQEFHEGLSGLSGQTGSHDGVYRKVPGQCQTRHHGTEPHQGRRKDGCRSTGTGGNRAAVAVCHSQPRTVGTAHYRRRRCVV